jgi:hypothetical protein
MAWNPPAINWGGTGQSNQAAAASPIFGIPAPKGSGNLQNFEAPLAPPSPAFCVPAVARASATETTASRPAVVACRSGHACIESSYPTSYNSCDVCRASIAMHSTGNLRCDRCDYDVCAGCVTAIKASSSSAAAAAAASPSFAFGSVMSSSPPTCAVFGASTGGSALPSPAAPLARNRSDLDAKIAETRQAVACTDAAISALLVRARFARLKIKTAFWC